jgi:hypothetical protein
MATSDRQAAAKSAAEDASKKTIHMSQYDKQVEVRLQALEQMASSKSNSDSTAGTGEERIAALEARLDDLVVRLNKKFNF